MDENGRRDGSGTVGGFVELPARASESLTALHMDTGVHSTVLKLRIAFSGMTLEVGAYTHFQREALMSTLTKDTEEALNLTSWEALNRAVERRDGVLRVSMSVIKEIADESTLKKNICQKIETQLANLGLAHMPPALPHSQGQHLILYKAGSPAASVIRAMQDGAASATAEDALRRLNTSTDAVEVQALTTQVNQAREQTSALADAVQQLRDTL